MLKNSVIGVIAFSCVLFFASLGAAEERFVYDSHNKRDPFLVLVNSDGVLVKVDDDTEKQELKVEGIIHDNSGVSFAIVNGDVVKVGDAVGGFQVLKIEENSVIFVKDGQAKEVVLTKEGN